MALIVLATVCYGFAVTLAGPLQQRYGSVNLMAKVLALALGVAFRDDEVFALELVGVAFVIGGAFLASRPTVVRAARGGSRRSGRGVASRHSGPSPSRRR